MALRAILRRIGAASPLVPALGYGGCILASSLLVAADPTSVLFAILALLLAAVATIALFAIVTWYRDDDWLAAGFLFGLTTMISGAVADVVVGMIQTGSIGGAVLTSVGMLFALGVRSLIAVPMSGGIIALARAVTRKIRAGFVHRPGPTPS